MAATRAPDIACLLAARRAFRFIECLASRVERRILGSTAPAHNPGRGHVCGARVPTGAMQFPERQLGGPVLHTKGGSRITATPRRPSNDEDPHSNDRCNASC